MLLLVTVHRRRTQGWRIDYTESAAPGVVRSVYVEAHRMDKDLAVKAVSGSGQVRLFGIEVLSVTRSKVQTPPKSWQ